MSTSVTTNGKRVYFYEKTSGLSYYDIPDISTRLSFPLTAKQSSSTVSVSSNATVILQPNTFVYGYNNQFDTEPKFRAAGSFVAESVFPVNAIGSFIPSVVKINFIEFRYYDPTKWQQFCTGIYTDNDIRCLYQTPSGRLYIEKGDTGRLGNLAGSSPGYADPTINYQLEIEKEDKKSISNFTIFILIMVGVISVVIVTISALLAFGLDGRKEDSPLNGDTQILR